MLDLTHRCEHCGGPMPERAPNGARIRHDRQYCCDKCRWDSRKTDRRYGMTERHCLHCGTVIPMETTLKRKFCCRKCNRDYYNAIRDASLLEAKAGRTCLTCGAPIEAEKKEGTRFCSRNCNARYHQRRKRAEAKRAKS